LCTVAPSFANDKRGEAARLIAELAPGDLNRVFFTNGGAEANENAIRMARIHTGRHKVLAMYRSYHGSTAAAITATGDPRRWANEPTAVGLVHFWGPYTYRSAFHAVDEAQESVRALAHLRDTIAFEGPATIAAVLLETVVGTNGILVPPPGYLAGVREICDEYGIMLIADEVMAGFGRCGEWFAVDHWRVTPDLITFAKGVNSGYLPLGGVVISDPIAETFRERVFPGGSPTPATRWRARRPSPRSRSSRRRASSSTPARSARRSSAPRCTRLAQRHPSVGEVRGLGVFWALELVRDRETRSRWCRTTRRAGGRPMNELAAACKQRGLWPFTHFNRVHVVPPCTITADEVAEGIAVLDEALTVADGYYTAPRQGTEARVPC
jgi:taurine--2-oxoglutarate transaminase